MDAHTRTDTRAALLWGLVMVVAWQQSYAHRKSRINGYLSFYRSSQMIRRVPIYVLSLGNTIFLALLAVVRDSPHSRTAAQAVYTVEVALCIPATLVYLAQLRRFNRKRDLPDVHRDLLARASRTDNQMESSDQFGDHELDDVLEKQADIIRFMKQHNDSLSRRIRHLTDQLGEYERGIQ